jgi:uncharacterized membrane protein YccC
MQDDRFWNVIESGIGSLIMTSIMGIFFHAPWSVSLGIFLVFWIGLYFTFRARFRSGNSN